METHNTHQQKKEFVHFALTQKLNNELLFLKDKLTISKAGIIRLAILEFAKQHREAAQ